MQALVTYTTEDKRSHTIRVNMPDGLDTGSDEALERALLALPDAGEPELVSIEEATHVMPPQLKIMCQRCGFTEKVAPRAFFEYEADPDGIWECLQCDNKHMHRAR